MSRESGRWETCVRVLAMLGLGLAATTGRQVEGGPREQRIHVKVPGMAGLYVGRAILGAQARLAQLACQAVLSDFVIESSGQPLSVALADTGLSPAGYLGIIPFEDGSQAKACRTGQAFAGMQRPGESSVLICPTAFRGLAERNPVLAESVVIHEMLHTLGLGENPPTSTQITARVVRRCVDDVARARSADARTAARK